MQPSDALFAQIKLFEGFRAVAYEDPFKPGLWSVGYGSSIGVVAGMQVSEAQASAMLRDHVNADAARLTPVVRVGLSQNQADALLSLSYNVGCGPVMRSHLVARVNANDPAAPAEFLRWDHDAKGDVVAGLKRRRTWEYQTFMRDAWPLGNSPRA